MSPHFFQHKSPVDTASTHPMIYILYYNFSVSQTINPRRHNQEQWIPINKVIFASTYFQMLSLPEVLWKVEQFLYIMATIIFNLMVYLGFVEVILHWFNHCGSEINRRRFNYSVTCWTFVIKMEPSLYVVKLSLCVFVIQFMWHKNT